MIRAPDTSGSHGHPHRLVPWHRRLLVASGALLLATGGLWIGVHYTLGAGAGQLPHLLEAWCLRLHGLAAFVALFVLGLLAASHVPQGWRRSGRRGWAQQRHSGLWLCSGASALVLTGYVLYYFAPEDLRPVMGWVHAGIGAATGWVLLRHRRGLRSPDGARTPRPDAAN
ncbi:MAG: hypothetical protein M3O01_00445 [Pseudomonadota bacterium]|nr:hypothetical protein [Pseudomonadota bacterium]